MFEPELFQLSASQFREFAALLVAPALGFLFIFLLGTPLSKLPGLPDGTDFKPPRWVLPLFALGSFFLLIGSATTGLSLVLMKSSASPADFLQSYQLNETLPVSDLDRIVGGTLTIESYDGISNFRVFVNNYRLFGTSANCMMKYQCLERGNRSANDFYAKAAGNFGTELSLHSLHQLYDLPHNEDFTGFIAAGYNAIDMQVNNGGKGDCRVSFIVKLGLNGDRVITRHIFIDDDFGPSTISNQNQDFSEEHFHTGGNREDLVTPYQTLRADPSYRVCQRIRLKFHVAPGKAPLEEDVSGKWAAWHRARLKSELCEVYNNKARYCGAL